MAPADPAAPRRLTVPLPSQSDICRSCTCAEPTPLGCLAASGRSEAETPAPRGSVKSHPTCKHPGLAWQRPWLLDGETQKLHA